MDDYTTILAAIDRIWPELPALLGDAWPDFAVRIAEHRRRGDADPAQQPLAAALILATFGKHQAADARLHELLASDGGQESAKIFFGYTTPGSGPGVQFGDSPPADEPTGGAEPEISFAMGDAPDAAGEPTIEIAPAPPPPPPPDPNAGLTAPTPKGLIPPAPPIPQSPNLQSSATVTRYTDITCPRRVWIDAPRVSVIVRLTAAPSQSSDVAVRTLAVRIDQPVQVTIQAVGFDLLNARTQSIAVNATEDSTPAVFDLKPQQVGMTSISLDFQQGGRPLDAVTWEVEITREQVVTQETRLSQVVTIDGSAAPPDLLLYVSEETIQGERHLRLHLFEQGQEAGHLFTAVPLKGSLQATADALLATLEQLTDTGAVVAAAVAAASAPSPAGAITPAPAQPLAPAEEPAATRKLSLVGAAPEAALPYWDRQQLELQRIEAAVRKLGEKLWWELIPGDFKQLYAERRAEWAGRSLLIVSDEPAIPWELVWPYAADWEDDSPWCLSFCLTRWLRRGEHTVGCSAPPAAVTVNALACVTPTDSGLTFTQREQEFLATWRTTHGVTDAGPAGSYASAVHALIDEGGYDWLHVASHGRVGAALGVRQGMLVLQDGGTLDADAFLGRGALRHLGRQHPGFFFNACHGGRQGWGLTYLAGWAPRLLELGASVVVAPLWTVGDEQAFAFATAFYNSMGATNIGAAVRDARLAARRAGDPTWLAYSVYAHPLAAVAAGSA